jgi:hypothetical protein
MHQLPSLQAKHQAHILTQGNAIDISKELVKLLATFYMRAWIGSPTTLKTRLEEIW